MLKSKAKQSIQDRKERLLSGRCPVHGLDMTQVGRTGKDEDGAMVVQCSRRDCQIQGRSKSYRGPVELEKNWDYLLRCNDKTN